MTLYKLHSSHSWKCSSKLDTLGNQSHQLELAPCMGKWRFSKLRVLWASIPSVALPPAVKVLLSLQLMCGQNLKKVFVWQCLLCRLLYTLSLHFTPGLQSAVHSLRFTLTTLNCTMPMISVTFWLTCEQAIIEYKSNRTHYLKFTALCYL